MGWKILGRIYPFSRRNDGSSFSYLFYGIFEGQSGKSRHSIGIGFRRQSPSEIRPRKPQFRIGHDWLFAFPSIFFCFAGQHCFACLRTCSGDECSHFSCSFFSTKQPQKSKTNVSSTDLAIFGAFLQLHCRSSLVMRANFLVLLFPSAATPIFYLLRKTEGSKLGRAREP